jgi:uncharacterized protein Veg
LVSGARFSLGFATIKVNPSLFVVGSQNDRRTVVRATTTSSYTDMGTTTRGFNDAYL